MDTRQLELFLSLSETLHFGRSSEACHVSPSALSRSIKQLEEQLDVTLFERDNRRVELTPAGRSLQNYARDTLRNWTTFKEGLQLSQGELRGELSIYCSVTASYSFLYTILSDFRQQHPHIELKLHTGDPAQGLQRVIGGHEDMAIIIKPDSLPQTLTFRRIAVSPLCFIGPSDSPSEVDWSTVPMIVSEEGISRERINRWFQRRKAEPTIYAQVAGHEAIVSMVALGFGIGVVPEIVLNNSPLADQVSVLHTSDPLGNIDVGLCVVKKRLKSPIVAAFWGTE